MDKYEFANKVSWEGGVIGALEYGVKAYDLEGEDEQTKTLRENWTDLVAIWKEAAPLIDYVDELIMELEYEEDE